MIALKHNPAFSLERPLLLRLPWPPSVNHYWRVFRGRAIVSAEGREYRRRMTFLALEQGLIEPLLGRLAVRLDVFPPDRKRRDLDNLLKAVLDGLRTAGVYRDDSQIDRLSVDRQAPRRQDPGIVARLHSL